MEWIEYVGIFRDIAVGLSAIFVAVTAWRGVSSWKKELKGKAEYETARCLLRSTHKLRDELKDGRIPAIFPSEYPEGQIENSSIYEDTRNFLYVYQNRWKPIHKAIKELRTQRSEAGVLWGCDIRLKVDELVDCAWSYRVAFDQIAKLQGEWEPGDAYKLELERDLRDEKPDENPLSKRIDATVKEIEDFVKPYLSRK